MTQNEKKTKNYLITIIPIGIALNIAIGTIVTLLKLPIYLDAIGTIIITLVAGLRAGIIVGVGSFLLAGITINPVLPWFCGTQAIIAVYAYFVARLGAFRNTAYTVLAGIGLGISAGIVSAPVIVAVFGGASGSGRDLITSFILSSSEQLLKSVALSGLTSEPLDKALQCLIAVWVIRTLPKTLLQKFKNPIMEKNNIL